MSVTTNKYTLVAGDDWQGLYCNDKLVLQDHRIRLEDAFCEVISSGGINQFTRIECDYDWLSDLGAFPDSLSEVKLCPFGRN